MVNLRQLRIGGWALPIPISPQKRILLGTALILGGLLGFLPVLGFWMLPLGLAVLSIDLPIIRRFRRRLDSPSG